MAGFDVFKDIFLAGVGAAAVTGEKAKEVVDTLIEKGGITIEQGKELNSELKHKGEEAMGRVRDEAIAAQVRAMSPEDRDAFAASVSRIVAEANAGCVTVDAEVVDAEAEPAEEAPEAEAPEAEAPKPEASEN